MSCRLDGNLVRPYCQCGYVQIYADEPWGCPSDRLGIADSKEAAKAWIQRWEDGKM